MFEAYLDESGIHDNATHCVVAGYYGARTSWERFEIGWYKLLTQFNVPLDKFHAKDLYPTAKGFFSSRWDQRSRHSEFLTSIAKTINNHHKIYPITCGLVVKDFNSFSHDVRRYLTGADIRQGQLLTQGCPSKPYFVLLQRCVIKICDYTSIGSHAHFCLGVDRQTYGGYAMQLFDEMASSRNKGGAFAWKGKLGKVAFPLAAATPQLQAADFLVNLTYHHMVNAGNKIGQVAATPLLQSCNKTGSI